MSANDPRKRSHDEILIESDSMEELPTKHISTEEMPSNEPQATSSTESSPLRPSLSLVEVAGVPGLLYCPNFVDKSEEASLLEAIDACKWDNTLKRRVQHFGLRYDYTSKSVDRNATIEPLPSFCDLPVERMTHFNVFSTAPDQCIVNGTSQHMFSLKSAVRVKLS